MDQWKGREDKEALEETVDGRVKEMSGNEGEGKSKKQKGTSFGKVSLRWMGFPSYESGGRYGLS